MVNLKLMALRKKKPEFVRQDYHVRPRVHDDTWRKPRGKHSKMRQHRIGKHAWVNAGYRMPREIRGLHISGSRIIRIENLHQLMSIEPKEEIAIMGRVGGRLKLLLLKKAQELGVKFVNVKDISKEILEIETGLKTRKEKKTEEAKKVEEKAKEKPKEKKKAKEEIKTEEKKEEPKTETSVKQAETKTEASKEEKTKKKELKPEKVADK